MKKEINMPNPLASISPLLELLAKEVKILPATGGAVEELLHPDQEEIEDIVINRDVETVNAFAETPEPDPQNIYRSTPPLPRTENHLFQFFIDGSIRTYFLGTGIEGTRSFSIELAQIGSAQPDYRFLDTEIKSNVTRLSKGELLLSHAVYRQPIKIIFPKPAFKQQEF